MGCEWGLHEFRYLRGVLYVSGWVESHEDSIYNVGIEIKDYDSIHLWKCEDDVHTSVNKVHFDKTINGITAVQAQNANLLIRFTSGECVRIAEPVQHMLQKDPYHKLQFKFYDLLSRYADGSVLEIGSRNVSGSIRRKNISSSLNYVGFDAIEGENVDVVGDAHLLSSFFKPDYFTAVFCISVFEHLIMPWKVVIEINKVLKKGGLFMAATHQSFPIHETPADFYRYSDTSWKGLFNKATGFKIIETAMGEKAFISADYLHPVTNGMENAAAFLGSSVIAEKTENTKLSWPVETAFLYDMNYPV